MKLHECLVGLFFFLGSLSICLFSLLNERKQAFTISNHVLSYSNIQDQGSYHPRKTHKLEDQQEVNNFAYKGGSSNDHGLNLCLWKNEIGQGNQISARCYQNIPTKWLPSKLRLVHKVMASDQVATKASANCEIKREEYHKGLSFTLEITENGRLSSSGTPIRVCTDCNTTKTPLWRSGPRGPKSLCNACGIRQRKARRALASSAAAANGTTLASEGSMPSKPNVQQKDRRLKIKTQISPCKKRTKLGKNNGRKLCFEDFLISLSKNLAFHQVFPQDEKEAAILLMALSCGLVHG